MREHERRLMGTAGAWFTRLFAVAVVVVGLGQSAVLLLEVYAQGRGSPRLGVGLLATVGVLVVVWSVLLLGWRWVARWAARVDRRRTRTVGRATRWLVAHRLEAAGINLWAAVWLGLWAAILLRVNSGGGLLDPTLVAPVLAAWFGLRALVQLWGAVERAVTADMRQDVAGDG